MDRDVLLRIQRSSGESQNAKLGNTFVMKSLKSPSRFIIRSTDEVDESGTRRCEFTFRLKLTLFSTELRASSIFQRLFPKSVEAVAVCTAV